MLLLAADENFDNDIVRGLLRRRPDIDIVRVQDVGLSGASDPIILEWAAEQQRLLLTHDVATITARLSIDIDEKLNRLMDGRLLLN